MLVNNFECFENVVRSSASYLVSENSASSEHLTIALCSSHLLIVHEWLPYPDMYVGMLPSEKNGTTEKPRPFRCRIIHGYDTSAWHRTNLLLSFVLLPFIDLHFSQ